MRRVPEMTEVDQPDKNTNDGDNLGQHVTEVVKFPLQRRLLADLRGNRLVNVTDCGGFPSKDHNGSRASVHDGSTLVFSQ